MINPNYISGYVDGEGSFLISFSPREKLLIGLEARPSFSVSQRKDRSEVLNLMKSYFGCGTIRYSKRDQTNRYEVRGLEDLITRIIPHFKNFPLLSSKYKDFKLFCKVCEMMRREERRTKKGLVKIIDIALKMNINGSRIYKKEFLFSKLKI